MTVAKFVQPNYTTQSAAVYKAAIDAAIAVLATIGGDYACHAKDTPDMQVLVDAGQLFLVNSTLVSNAQQTSTTIVAPVGNPRIDRIVINDQTGVMSVITGTPAASPTAPAITAGTRPIAQILLQTSTTQITNSMITDERVVTTFDVSTFIRTLLDDADAAAARTTLGAASLGANIFTNTQSISHINPQYTFTETDATVDNKHWDFLFSGEAFTIRTLNDAFTVSGEVITAQRTGTTVDSVTIGGTTVSVPGSIAVSGSLNSTKVAASGYTRVAPNMCMKTGAFNLVSLTRDAVTTLTPPDSNAKALLVWIRVQARSANSIGSRYSQVDMHSNDTAAGGLVGTTISQAYEHTAVAVGTTLGGIDGQYILQKDTGYSLYFTDDAGNNSAAFFEVRGYID